MSWWSCYRKLAPLLFLTVFLSSCDRPRKSVDPKEYVRSPLFSKPAPQTRDANDVGRFLAGLPGVAGSPFAGLEKQEEWKEHSRQLNDDWAEVQAGGIPAMSQFQTEALGGSTVGNSVVFYPFSGPDALMVGVFFPHCPTFVMVGLEPPGTLPAPNQLAAKDLGIYLDDVRSTIYSELHRSFFITREMDRQFRGQVSDGLLPTILHLLVRTNHTIVGHRYVRLEQDGSIAGRAAGDKTAGPHGVQIDFRAGSDRLLQRLYYFSVNLSDSRLGKDQPFLNFLAKLSGVTTYMKATSYMPHHPEFSIVRRQILDRSAAILQDDSGIPYRFFDPKQWRVQLYGAFDHPYGSFKWLAQPDLKKAYETLNPKPLHFRIGYGFSKVPSNLLLAVRIGPDQQAVR